MNEPRRVSAPVLPTAVDTSAPHATHSPTPWGPAVFVGGIWIAAVLGAVGFVATFGRNIPFWNVWSLVPVLAGKQRVSLSWLWSVHNEHRIPLPRVVELGLYTITGWDMPAGMFANVSLLGALALLMIGAARRLRGRTSYADAFFPLVLLHWGHWENLLRGFQLQFVLSAFLSGLLLVIIARCERYLTVPAAAGAGLCLVGLPLCGANGLALVPALGLWFGYAGMRQWRSAEPSEKAAGRLMLLGAAVAIAVVPLYFLGYEPRRRTRSPACARRPIWCSELPRNS